jgi:hypothetical protein
MKALPSLLVLAFEPRRSRFGYALFGGPKRLLDWGASVLPTQLLDHDMLTSAHWRVLAVFQRCTPTVVVVDRPRRMRTNLEETGGPVFKSVLHEAERLRVPVHVLNREEIRAAFSIFRARSKEQIALALAGIFPELTHRLPLKRKKWQPERRGMIVFDAVAVGLAYWLRQDDACAPPE